jgi:hypothetical protein
VAKKKKSKKERTVEAFRKINKARDVRKGHEERWKKIIRYYEGYAYVDDQLQTHQDYINVNIFKANVQTFIAATYFQNPKTYAKPANKFVPDAVKTGPVIEAELNYWIRELDFKDEVRRSQLDWCLVGHGWMKQGYFGQITEKERADDESGVERETDLNIEGGQPFVKRVSPFRMLVDPAALTYPEAKWVAEEIYFPWDEAKRRWPELEDIKGLQTFMPDKVPAPSALEKDRWDDKERQDSMVLLVQYWYQKWNEDDNKYDIWVMLLCDGADEFLSDEKMELSVEGFPYDFVAWDERVDSFYPQNIYDAAEDLFHSYDKLRSMEINHMRKNGRYYEMRRDAYTQEAIEDLKRGIDGTVLMADSIDQENIKPIQDAPLDPQHYVNIRQIEKEIRVILGLDENITSSTQKGVTATQTERASQGTTIRLATRRDALGSFVSGAISKLWQILQGHHDAEDFVEIVGPEGAKILDSINPTQIEGEYRIEMAVNSTAPPDKRQDIKDAMDLYNLLRQDPKVDARGLILNIVDKMQIPGIEDLVKAPDELEKATIAEESQMLEQGQPALVHAGDEHQMHMAQQGPRAEELANAAKALTQQFEEAKASFGAEHQNKIQSGIPLTPEEQERGQKLLNMQETAQQTQKLAQIWQQHVAKHQEYIASDMGAGEPSNPQLFSQRAGRTSDDIAENSAGFQGPGK